VPIAVALSASRVSFQATLLSSGREDSYRARLLNQIYLFIDNEGVVASLLGRAFVDIFELFVFHLAIL